MMLIKIQKQVESVELIRKLTDRLRVIYFICESDFYVNHNEQLDSRYLLILSMFWHAISFNRVMSTNVSSYNLTSTNEVNYP